MTDADTSCHATVVDFPTLMRPTPRAEPRSPTFRAIYSAGQWTVVGALDGDSVQMTLNPFRRNSQDDETLAKRLALLLDNRARKDAALRLVLAACQMFEEARANGIDAGADLVQFAQMARESIR